MGDELTIVLTISGVGIGALIAYLFYIRHIKSVKKLLKESQDEIIQKNVDIANAQERVRQKGGSLELQNNIEKLRVASLLLKESLMHISSEISALQWDSVMKITPIDLVLIKNSIISSESFLRENNLLGQHTGQSSYTEGFNSILHQLEKVNTYIEAYNREITADKRRQLWGQFLEWGAGSNSVANAIKFIDGAVKLSEEFLSKYR